ncbi:hypothetical protein PEL8287_02069 [Roseovarius litorisediminis]|uniref:YjiS-like domain-containing protein n=1 Tax=Roseovarius litorisediminis TaxID=1312363 RepID=A0A1Y5SMX0_9RHOB|nr:DUF1127 domain-containing protein [Roseovarius litorisediminis]SLN41427.1 hypothetical protein PEL8287_02069 [Roseovarius litorisediminis]
MAVIDTTRTHAVPAGQFGQAVAKFVGAFAAWNDARATRKALSQLSDRELDDIGLCRSDIDSVVRQG